MRTSCIVHVVLALLVSACSPHEAHRAAVPPSVVERPEFYTSARIDATVVDARTGAAVSNAAVVAIWRRIEVLTERWDGMDRIVQTQTDASGRFTIPRWGPHTLGYDDYLDSRDPELWVLKNGYLLGYFDETGSFDPRLFSARRTLPVRKPPPNTTIVSRRRLFSRSADATSRWNGKTLPLSRAGNVEETVRSLTAADPIEPYEPAHVRLPAFAAEWLSAWQALPPAVHDQACCPRAITDSITPDERARLGLPADTPTRPATPRF